jgi:hypothetical protein
VSVRELACELALLTVAYVVGFTMGYLTASRSPYLQLLLTIMVWIGVLALALFIGLFIGVWWASRSREREREGLEPEPRSPQVREHPSYEGDQSPREHAYE